MKVREQEGSQTGEGSGTGLYTQGEDSLAKASEHYNQQPITNTRRGHGQGTDC